MAASTSSTGYNSGYLVTASGTYADVLAEIKSGTTSACPCENIGNLISITGLSTASCFAAWYTKTKL